VARIDGTRVRPVAARGHAWVSGLEVEEEGAQRRIRCDLIAVAALPAPASELPRHHGATVELRPDEGGFSCVVDEGGRTDAPAVFACGDVCGFRGVERSRTHGEIVGAALAASM
jgi:thioredoxin reductase